MRINQSYIYCYPGGLRTVTSHTCTRQKDCYIKFLLSSYSSGIYSKKEGLGFRRKNGKGIQAPELLYRRDFGVGILLV